MSKQTINIGASPNDGTGTPLRTSFDYTNQNFTELYTALGGGVGLPGATTQVIFNDGGTNLAGDAGLVYNKTTDALTVAGLVTAGSATITGDLTVRTNKLKVDATGVGIGTASPTSGTLTVQTHYLLFPDSQTKIGDNGFCNGAASDGNTQIQFFGGRSLFFNEGASNTKMTLNSTGLGIGASPSALLHVQKSQNNETTVILNNTNAGAAAAARLDLQSHASNYLTLQSYGQNYSGNVCGIAAAKLNAIVDNSLTANSTGLLIGTVSTNPLYFVTANAVKMTLDASGNLLVGTTSASGRVAVDTDLATYNGMAVKNTGTTYGASSFFFRFINSSGVTAGSIQHTAVTTTNYSTTSDSRLKESKGISTDTSVIDNTIVRDFVWKADGSTDRGVFAQEAQSVKPRAISAGSDDLTEDGNIKTPWSVDYSKYVPDLIVYCQQLKKQVVELTARVQTLEAR